MDWIELSKQYVVNMEGQKKRVTRRRVTIMAGDDEDYLLELRSARGSIYRYSNDGRWWAVYLAPTKMGNRRTKKWLEIEGICARHGGVRVQGGLYESVWKFPSQTLSLLAQAMKMKRRGRGNFNVRPSH